MEILNSALIVLIAMWFIELQVFAEMLERYERSLNMLYLSIFMPFFLAATI